MQEKERNYIYIYPHTYTYLYIYIHGWGGGKERERAMILKRIKQIHQPTKHLGIWSLSLIHFNAQSTGSLKYHRSLNSYPKKD